MLLGKLRLFISFSIHTQFFVWFFFICFYAFFFSNTIWSCGRVWGFSTKPWLIRVDSYLFSFVYFFFLFFVSFSFCSSHIYRFYFPEYYNFNLLLFSSFSALRLVLLLMTKLPCIFIHVMSWYNLFHVYYFRMCSVHCKKSVKIRNLFCFRIFRIRVEYGDYRINFT